MAICSSFGTFASRPFFASIFSRFVASIFSLLAQCSPASLPYLE